MALEKCVLKNGLNRNKLKIFKQLIFLTHPLNLKNPISSRKWYSFRIFFQWDFHSWCNKKWKSLNSGVKKSSKFRNRTYFEIHLCRSVFFPKSPMLLNLITSMIQLHLPPQLPDHHRPRPISTYPLPSTPQTSTSCRWSH